MGLVVASQVHEKGVLHAASRALSYCARLGDLGWLTGTCHMKMGVWNGDITVALY